MGTEVREKGVKWWVEWIGGLNMQKSIESRSELIEMLSGGLHDDPTTRLH